MNFEVSCVIFEQMASSIFDSEFRMIILPEMSPFVIIGDIIFASSSVSSMGIIILFEVLSNLFKSLIKYFPIIIICCY